MAAQGTVTNNYNAKRTIQLTASPTGAVAVPTLGTDGVPNYPVEAVFGSDTGACYATMAAKQSTISIGTTAGATPSAKFNVWGYLAASGKWYLVAQLNAGAVIVATSTGQIQYSQTLINLGHYDRLAVEINTVTGTMGTIEAYLTTDRGVTT